jgi:hypothetical protein
MPYLTGKSREKNMTAPMPSPWGDLSAIFAGSPTDLMTIGGLWFAPFGTTLPTDVDTPLDPAFTNLGFISDKGVKIKIDDQTKPIDVWGGDEIGELRDKYMIEYSMELFQILSPAVNAAIFGTGNVTTAAANALHGNRMKVLLNNKLPVKCCLVLDAFYEDKALRQVASTVQRAGISDMQLVHNAPLLFEPTFKVLRGTDGNHVVQYTDDGQVISGSS